MNVCERCSLSLPAGAAHVNEESCILALKAELDRIRCCAGCGRAVKVGVCPGCAAKGLAKGAAMHGASTLGAAFWRWLHEGPAPDEGEPERGGKRFVP